MRSRRSTSRRSTTCSSRSTIAGSIAPSSAPRTGSATPGSITSRPSSSVRGTGPVEKVYPVEPPERIVIRDGGRTVFVPLSDIDWIEAADYYVQLHVGAKTYLHREPMRDLEARLDPRRFVRIHRSAIVALDRVAELRPSSHGDH